MFLRRRATQAEYFDLPERSFAEVRESFEWLGRVNQLTHFERPFRLWIPRLLPEPACRELTVLDLGAGDGALGRTLKTWAAGRGWTWQFTNLDLNPMTERLDSTGPHVTGSVLEVPFPERSFDEVLANTMTHHLQSDAEVIRHFQEASRVARRLVLLCDLHRNVAFHGVLWVLLQTLRAPHHFRSDGLLSVRRGWRVAEWRDLAEAAGLDSAQVWMEHGTRVLLAIVKP